MEFHIEDDIEETMDPESRSLKNHIQNYTIRNWTYLNDSLNALQGILSRSSIDSLQGVPLLKAYSYDKRSFDGDKAQSLARGLSWSSPNAHTLLCRADSRRSILENGPEKEDESDPTKLIEDVVQRMEVYDAPSWSQACLPNHIDFDGVEIVSSTSTYDAVLLLLDERGSRWRTEWLVVLQQGSSTL